MSTSLIALALLAPAPEAIEHEVHAALAQAEHQVAVAMEQVGDPMAMAFAGAELGRERVVKGAPYCADAVHESIQTLADGSHITRKQSTRLCRDGEGRTRREVQGSGGPRVYLRDPVSKESWLLDPERKTARRVGGHGIELNMHGNHGAMGEAWREWAREFSQRMRESVKDMTPPRPPKAPKAPGAAPEPAVVIENEVVIKHGEGEPQRQRDVRVIRLSDLPAGTQMAPLPPMPPTPPIPAMPAIDLRLFMPRGEGVQQALPAKEIEGVKVNGERTTWTIEAGKIGNDRPLLITREVWTSPELMLTVQSRDFDPRSGEVNYRLEHLKRGEPDAALMKVPADYQPSGAVRTPRVPATPAPRASGTKSS